MKREASTNLGQKEAEVQLIGVPGDISKPETGREFVKRVTEAFGGRLDVFVSNAGVCEFADFLR